MSTTRKQSTKAWYAANKERVAEQHRAYDARNRPKRRIRYRDKRYGFAPGEYDAMLAAQGGVCAICGKAETSKSNHGGLLPLAVDHDHESGLVGALLCHNCNKGLGSFRDDPELLRAAADYLNSVRPRHRVGV